MLNRQDGAPLISAPPLNQTLEQMLERLAQCGIALAEPFSIQDLLDLDDREGFEHSSYENLMGALGGTEAEPPYRLLCDSYYHLDMKCIEVVGNYTEFILALAALTKGDVVISEIQEETAMGRGGPSHISFKFNGKPLRIDFEQDWKYFNEQLLDRILHLLRTTTSRRQYFMVYRGGEDIGIGCLFPEQIAGLRRLGIELEIV